MLPESKQLAEHKGQKSYIVIESQWFPEQFIADKLAKLSGKEKNTGTELTVAVTDSPIREGGQI